MSESFIGEIRIFAGNFPPAKWSYCDGATLPISQNQELFSLLGTAYGGDGRSTFLLPDMRGRLPVSQGQGLGLTDRKIGQNFGTERVALTADQIPSHTHQMMASNNTENSQETPTNLTTSASQRAYSSTSNATLASQSVMPTGSGTVHTNMMPYLAVHFIISLMGYYPSRN